MGEKLKLVFRQTVSLGYLLVPGIGLTTAGATLIAGSHQSPWFNALFILGIACLLAFPLAMVCDLRGMIPRLPRLPRRV
jgi:hypothetical protein